MHAQRTLIRQLFFFCFFLFVLGIEHSIGLPVFSLTMAVLQIVFLPEKWKIVGLILFCVVISLVYTLPFAVTALLLSGLTLYLKYQDAHFQGQLTLFFILLLLSTGVMSVVLQFQWTPPVGVVYGASIALLYVFLHYWLYRVPSGQRLSFAKRLGKKRV